MKIPRTFKIKKIKYMNKYYLRYPIINCVSYCKMLKTFDLREKIGLRCLVMISMKHFGMT